MKQYEKAVVILSGGLDSTTCLGVAVQEGEEVYALTFDYGQRHRIEIESAKKVAEYYRVKEHQIATLPFLRAIGGSALTDKEIAVPHSGVIANEIPVTYVPGRNLIFLSIATAYAEVVGANAIYLGVNALDYSGYPDCRPAFIESFARTATLATKAGAMGATLQIKTPLLYLSKAEIVTLGTKLGVPYELTSSCYEGGSVACGVCDSCRLRRKGFAEAGLTDPIAYSERIDVV
ncbi:7-cyano-7-deazaguanine synthase QueC [Sulfoacidibacillus thermotolerans]|uniref:7-cyano-7-deazaguanine synthase n=1 Tax=Sulfoacidibacillus thermotolerans TaxID=1765684 RepID=A0A2U3D6S5_SULT2|nr:7-cyano-7-deazaguanine synthase QueC [Sulfoacidibacillus thermotolerans]PWI56953.1 7-cyano-7-deazaguanine synthase QueC [Sulfoacidibacillus thermotolerans]